MNVKVNAQTIELPAGVGHIAASQLRGYNCSGTDSQMPIFHWRKMR
jgi:hypothetical protein